MDHAEDSTCDWLARLKAGEAEAVQQLWSRYSGELLRIAKQRLGKLPSGIADEEDVAQSVFGSICRGAAEGRFDKISSRDELWWLLLSITKRKAVDQIRRETAQKRGGAAGKSGLQSSNGVPASWALTDLVSSSPTPDFVVALQEQYGRLLDVLRNDHLREIVLLRIEGYSGVEIASKLSIGLRAVERKLQLIRAKWKYELLKSDRG